MKIGKVVLAGTVVGILNSIWGWLTCGWLFNWVYLLEPIFIWKQPNEMPFALMGVTGIVFAILLALVYMIIYKGLPGKGIVKGLWFGLFVWLVGGLPGVFSLGMCTVMAWGVIIYWIIGGLVVCLWQGLVIAAIYGDGEPKELS
ncbi:MAG: hypothetical protein ABID79_04315 [Elusimicrobiota bacterium]